MQAQNTSMKHDNIGSHLSFSTLEDDSKSPVTDEVVGVVFEVSDLLRHFHALRFRRQLEAFVAQRR
jgi:hypothetical protein